MNLDKTFTLPIQPQFLADPMSGTHLSSGLFLSVESRELRERTSAGCESHLAQPPGVSSSLSGRVLYADGWAKKYNVAVHCSQCTQRTPTAILTAVPSPLHCHVLPCTMHTTGNLHCSDSRETSVALYRIVISGFVHEARAREPCFFLRPNIGGFRARIPPISRCATERSTSRRASIGGCLGLSV